MRGVAVEPPPSWEPACMEPDELELFRAGRARGCVDCTQDFAALMAREGRCNGIPGDIARLDIIPFVADLEGPDSRSPILRPDGSRRPYRPAIRKELLTVEAPNPRPTRLPVPDASPRVDALRELAAAAEEAADAQLGADRAGSTLATADARLQNALIAIAPKKAAKKPDTRTTEERKAAVPPTSDELTPRQQQILDMTIAHNGDRMAVANTLGVTYQAVDETLYRVAGKGKLPPDILAKMPDRFQQLVTESATRDESSG